MEKIYTQDNAKNKIILAGEIYERCNTGDGSGDLIFLKKVKANHFVRIKQAYGISCDVLDQLKEKNIKLVIIETPAYRYISSLSEWTDPRMVDDLGHGPQSFLPINLMRQTSTNGE